MASTPNLQLTLLEGASVVDFGQLNSWVNVLDRLGVEYVTDKGSGGKGTWWYRKWSSGRAECGVDAYPLDYTLPIDHDDIWPPLKTNAARLPVFGNYPINFAERPYANICFNNCTSKASMIIIQSTTSSATQAPEFIVAGASAWHPTLVNAEFSIFCTGNTR